MTNEGEGEVSVPFGATIGLCHRLLREAMVADPLPTDSFGPAPIGDRRDLARAEAIQDERRH